MREEGGKETHAENYIKRESTVGVGKKNKNNNKKVKKKKKENSPH